MKLGLMLALLIAPATLVGGTSAGAPLEGCLDPSVLANALEKLHQKDWREVSVGGLQAMWPTKLVGIDCDSAVCRSIGSKGRIIDGQYECTETFFFEVKQDAGRTPKTELKNLVIHYSSRSKAEVVEAAKMLARASGLSGFDLLAAGRQDHQDFHWDGPTGNVFSGLNLDLNKEGGVWILSFNLSRFPK